MNGEYNFFGLSTRSFEQLVQALAVKYIGPKTMVFGDGPDGAREATYDGRTAYPDATQPWQGYLVVQAKFKQRSDGTGRDGQWLLEQARHELNKFLDPKRNLRRPEYYILATNVSLSAAKDSGAKDKVLALLKEYGKKLSWKGFDVWDQEKLRTFLDNSRDIATRYACFITSGDVLAKMATALQFSRPDFERAMALYLQKELINDHFVNLEQAGHITDERISLASVFVDLPVSPYPVGEAAESHIVRHAETVQFANYIQGMASQRLSQDMTAAPGKESEPGVRIGKYVLIGGPGQGKTTLGQFICQLYRAAVLVDRQDQLSYEARDSIKELTRQCDLEHTQLPTARRFPLRIVLSDLAASLASKHTSSLLSFIVDKIKRKTDFTVSADDVRLWLASYPWLLILDGLDEVPPSANRDELLRIVRDFSVDAASANADLLVIATTRPQGYNEDFSPRYYTHLWLTPLTPETALHYADRLVRRRYPSDSDRRDRVRKRLERACEEESTVRLMRSPLQVTIMCTLVETGGQPPQERWSLFNEYYEVIYKREVERDTPIAPLLREQKTNIDIIHHRVGFVLQLVGETAGGSAARLSKPQFEEIVLDRLQQEGYTNSELERLKYSLIEAAMTRLVFLVAPEAEKIGFEIRSLQEFMAAEEILDAKDALIPDRLRQIAPNWYWRNVFLFCAGKCFEERQPLRATVYTVCAELNEDLTDSLLKFTLAGSVLALELLEDGCARRQPKYRQLLTRLALRLLELPATELRAGERLAQIYTTDLKDIFFEAIREKLVSQDFARRMGSWSCLLWLAVNEIEWASDLKTRNWPADPSELLQAFGSRRSEDAKVLTALQDVFPAISPWKLTYESLRFVNLREDSRMEPEWLSGVNAVLWPYITSSEVAIPLKGLGANLYISSPTMRFLSVKEHWTKPLTLFGMPHAVPDWEPLRKGLSFAQDPSLESLVECLRIFKDALPTQGTTWHQLMPWPIAACLSDGSGNLQNNIERAMRGEFGAASDWVAAEDRWRSQGLTQTDIETMTDDDSWPIPRNIAIKGFVFHGFPSIYIGSHHEYANPSPLRAVYDRLRSGRVKSMLAGLIMRLLSGESPGGLVKISPQELESMFSIIPTNMRHFSLDLFEAVTWGTYSEHISLIDRVGREANFYDSGDPSSHEIGRELTKLFVTDPSRIGILRLLAASLASFDIPEHLLDVSNFKSDEDRMTAILVRIGQGNWHEPDTEKLAQEICELCERSPMLVHQFRAKLIRSRNSPARLEILLVSIRKHLAASKLQVEFTQVLQELMNDVIRRRISQFHNRQLRTELQFTDFSIVANEEVEPNLKQSRLWN